VNHDDIPSPGSKVHDPPLVAAHFPLGDATGEATGDATGVVGEATGEATGVATGEASPSGLFFVSPVPLQWPSQHCSHVEASAISHSAHSASGLGLQ